MYYTYFPTEFSSYEDYIKYLKDKGLALEAPKYRKEEKTMKAKIKETGEIVDVYHEPQHGQITNIYKESVFVNSRIWTEDELIFLNASEVKEANLEKELDFNAEVSKFINTFYKNAKIGHKLMIRRTARYFYDLGLKAKGE